MMVSDLYQGIGLDKRGLGQSLANREINREYLSESRSQKGYQRARLQHKVGGVLDVSSGDRSDAGGR